MRKITPCKSGIVLSGGAGIVLSCRVRADFIFLPETIYSGIVLSGRPAWSRAEYFLSDTKKSGVVLSGSTKRSSIGRTCMEMMTLSHSRWYTE